MFYKESSVETNQYKFVVDTAKLIDIDRILKEQKDAGHLVSMVFSDTMAYILIHKEFLNRFSVNDKVSIGGWFVCSNWGYMSCFVGQDAGSFKLAHRNPRRYLTNGQWRPAEKKNTYYTIREIERACAFVRNVSVTVKGF